MKRERRDEIEQELRDERERTTAIFSKAESLLNKCVFCGKIKPTGIITDKETLRELNVCSVCVNDEDITGLRQENFCN